MCERMAQNTREWRSLGGRLLGVDEGRQLSDGCVALLEPGCIVLKVEHRAPCPNIELDLTRVWVN